MGANPINHKGTKTQRRFIHRRRERRTSLRGARATRSPNFYICQRTSRLNRFFYSLCLCAFAVRLSFSVPAFADVPTPTTLPDTHMRSPAEELSTIVLQDGYHLELVASDPDLISPVLCVWDGNGRMYVAEMRSYMLDINGTKAHTTISCISRWESTRHDWNYDKHTTFVDNLMLPRAVLPLDDRILVRTTDTKDLYTYRDTKNAGVADEKVKVFDGGKQEGNLEHQPSGLLWNLDNNIYQTYENFSLRFTRGKMEKDPLALGTGQWGIAMDDTGRMIYATAGSERPAHNFQVNPLYADVELPGQLLKNFEEVYPIEHLTDVEGGPPRLRPGGGLNHFTACGGGSIYRGDALPHDLYGNYILPEPVGRLIRRARVREDAGKITIENFYDKKEFIASTDANFRPVWSATGPDGCLYICDMYHGIIQEANWTKEGSYLRPQIQKYGLDKHINRGRIWRLVRDDTKKREQPHMLDETPAQLVLHLSDPNGWWRDTAQKLIILRGDKTVASQLRELANNDTNPITRLHALWTLDGLDQADVELLVAKLKDADPRVRAAAVRIAEPMLRENHPVIYQAIQQAALDPDPGVVEQVCMSMYHVHMPGAETTANMAIAAREKIDKKNNVVKLVMNKYRDDVARRKAEDERQRHLEMVNPVLAAMMAKGRNYYGQTCVACHAPSGMGTASPEHNGTTLAPPLKGSARLLGDKSICTRIALHGLVGPNNGKVYPGQMASFKTLDDVWLASILTFARNEWGNQANIILPEDVARMRRLTADHDKPFTTDQIPSPQPRPPMESLVVHPRSATLGSATSSMTATINAPGTYAVIVRASTALGRSRFAIDIAGESLTGLAVANDPADIPVGVVHLDSPGKVEIAAHVVGKTESSIELTSIRLERRF
jgi:mono/diheme cytochrome c family protein